MGEEMRASSAESGESPGANSTRDGDGSVSSDTSPSSPGLHFSPDRNARGDHSLTGEALALCSNLDNYLPLGCLCFEDATPEDDQVAVEWRDVAPLPPPPLSVLDGGLYAHLQKLASSGWVRVFSRRSHTESRYSIFRIYILPFDVGLRLIDRQSNALSVALRSLVGELDVSTDAWNGSYTPHKAKKFDMWATKEEGSLFWMFNRIPSPTPSVGLVKEKYAREALEDILDPASLIPGLKTQLYPYQRRSAGLMIQREAIASLELDPRLEHRIAPDGSDYYYNARDLTFLRHPRYYEASRGGVLAETMGLGKTLICLATILATKDHLPKIPAPYSMRPVRSSVARLADMAISATNRKSIPWKVEFQRIRHATGDEMASCREKLMQSPASYEIPIPPTRWNRKTVEPPPKKMTLAPTTLIVVPRNLCKQWQSEIRKHVGRDFLRVLVMDDTKKALPPPEALRLNDIVLFTRSRFEMEIKDGADELGRRLGTTARDCRCSYKGASRDRDCHCLRVDALYDSPLKHLHFKRLIIDEGHFFSNSGSVAVTVVNKLITADHRWVVSGTPAKDLLGVEVDMSAAENLWHTPSTKDSRDAILNQRRHFNKKDDLGGAIKSLGALATHFLRIKPWCASDTPGEHAEWDDHIYRHEHARKRTYSGFSTCLTRTMQAMVVKTQPEDVEKDIDLPPLSHEVVRLEPSFYDKLTANLFTLVLTANAVTSERTDVDYLFHKNSLKARSQLISNLRQSAFFWTGFSEADVLASLKSSSGYLAKEGTACMESDRVLLTETLAFADTILQSEGWKSLSRSHELGLFVEDWPSESAEHWGFDDAHKPLLTGISQLLEAQKHVNERVSEEDPSEGLAGAGIRALAPARYGTATKNEGDKPEAEKSVMTKLGIPISSIDGEPSLRRRASLSKSSPRKPFKTFKVTKPQQKQRRTKAAGKSDVGSLDGTALSMDAGIAPPPSTAAQEHTPGEGNTSLPPGSPFLRSRIIGTTSAKLSYLVSQILKHYQQEKILVFYDGDNVAYYIAQMLELLHIKHEIYAKSLAAHLKSEYVVRFDQEEQDRVLLMDVRNAAFGLNIRSASRIYFINPVCRPDIEAQAIKRAHRIGQTRKVWCETLVLKNTVEERMLDRSKRMTRSEHREAKVLEDDGDIRQIIQSARIIPVDEHESHGYGQMAPLEEAQQLWSRPGWEYFMGSRKPATSIGKKRKSRAEDDEMQDYTATDGSVPSKRRVIRRNLAFVDCTDAAHGPYTVDADGEEDASDDEPILNKWQRRSSTLGPPPEQHLEAMSKRLDPLMPSMNGGETPIGMRAPRAPNQSSVDAQPSIASGSNFQKLSIGELLNEEQRSPEPQTKLGDTELLKEILRLL
ncbi:hypothetical protein LTR37_008390 [Vermiconidia calcicola]|uniref:Uncharacterized protein n=1 Tax=Vermiconidia calcicola TaxID=1690605 RepID=A0ACC3NCN8_9PEZI|nr:hypothetical protein LTR37_008390 [Vermiconidia calcicola]